MLLYGLLFGGLDLLSCSRQSAFGEECSEWFQRARLPQRDTTAALAGALRKDQKRSSKLELEEIVQGGVT